MTSLVVSELENPWINHNLRMGVYACNITQQAKIQSEYPSGSLQAFAVSELWLLPLNKFLALNFNIIGATSL